MSEESHLVDHRLKLLRRHWQQTPLWQMARDAVPREKHFTVAISREAGASGKEIAQAVGARLDWAVYDCEILDLIAQRSGLRGEVLATVDEHDTNWLVEAFAAFGHQPTVNSTRFVHHLVRVMAALAERGRCIIVGRGATSCLPRETTLRVRVVADLNDRVAHIAKDRRLSDDQARATVRHLDRDRSRFVASHFHRDVADAHNFDLLLNSSRLDVDACAQVIIDALKAMRDAAKRNESAASEFIVH